MTMQLTPDRSFLLCELAAILSVLANVPAAAQTSVDPTQATDSDRREPITFDHVYGDQRLSIGGFTPFRITWLDDEHYIQRDSQGWKKHNARTGAAEPWYDRQILKASLVEQAKLPADRAEVLSAGGWIDSLPTQRLVVFKEGTKLIRMTLDGADVAIVNDLPDGYELATLSPTGSGLAFVLQNELWVADFEAHQLRQLTHDSSESVRNAKADWVYFEEVYDRDWKAYRWSPDGRMLAYQQFDDTSVPTFQIADHATVTQSFETERYPKAGETNPTVRLGVIPMNGGATQWIDASSYDPADLLIVHFNWLPDSSAVYWYAQNRIQTWLDVLTARLENGQSSRLWRDETKAWVDNPKDVKVLADGSFLIFSERTGWRHLYRMTKDGKSVTSITRGEWEVRDMLAVSADESSVVVSGTMDSPIAENIYRVQLTGEGEPQRLTTEAGHHNATVSTHGGCFVDSHSSLKQPVSISMRDGLTGEKLRELVARSAVPTDKYRLGNVEFLDFPMADGSTTTAIRISPPKFDATKRYPVWLKTYGGPHAPTVKDMWNSRLADHLLANLGIVVMHYDPRSASGRGAQSAWLAYRNLGVEETKDLESVCDWLAAQPWVDATHIGQSGHSYGGYFTAYAMTHSNRLCAGIAGAPVTDWANYDTIYTERFMGTPQDNPDGFRSSSVVAEAAHLNGRLLVLHGLLDDNVHPENSIQLTHALQSAGKSFELMLYPKARHGISGKHYNLTVFNFIVTAMGKPEAAR